MKAEERRQKVAENIMRKEGHKIMPEVKIERYEVITPDSIVPDTYENITVKTTTGTTVKVNKKHEALHQLFYDACEGHRALKLGYASYMNKEYVHTAEFFDGKPPMEKQVDPITAGVEKTQVKPEAMTPDKWADKDRITRESIEAQVAFKGTVELMVAKIILPTGELAVAAVDWALARLKPLADTGAPHEEEDVATAPQLKKIYAVSKEKGYTPELATSIMIRLYQTAHSKELTKQQASEFIAILSEGKYLNEPLQEPVEPEGLPF